MVSSFAAFHGRRAGGGAREHAFGAGGAALPDLPGIPEPPGSSSVRLAAAHTRAGICRAVSILMAKPAHGGMFRGYACSRLQAGFTAII
ncbi:hypothetical protein Ate01nite_64800 [Actinoplanes teichomyceticus]|nr:hypothetical protein Ate01nite_64800 [Actinoplanes teichomyceticus]